jgi:DNA-binding FadR family transcriptional regulator
VPGSLPIPSPQDPPPIGATSHTLADSVADELRRRVVAGEWPPGERLPPERVLIAELGVSRTVLREALFSLEALGLIESRSTRGRFVTESGTRHRSESLLSAWLRQHQGDLADWDEVLALTEAQIIRSLDVATARDLARRLRAVLVDQELAGERGDHGQVAECDADFHRLVLAAARNRALGSLGRGIIDNTWHARLAVFARPVNVERSLQHHRAIVDALAAGDLERAAELDAAHHNQPWQAGADGAVAS